MNEVRLIDANALTKIIEREIYYAENPTIHRTLNYCLGVIDNAPTVEPKLSDEQIEQITELLENEWGYEGMREDVSRILRGAE